TVTFEKDVYAITTNLGSGITNFNTISGNTTSNIVFSGDGKANLNGYLDGNINFAGNDAVVNIADGKGILGSVETLANNTGILNFSGDGVVDDLIGSALYGINELNINTNDEQDKDSNGTVTSNGLLARKEIFADIINLRNNATLTLADNANITNTGLNSLIISTDNANTGNLVFEGSSSVTGTVGSSSKNLESIVAGASGETVTFNNMVYASNLKYASDGTVILKGNNDTNNEGFIGNVDFNSNAGTLEIADNVNLTTGSSGIEFTNANDATLTFNGTSTVYGILGGNTTGNSTFERIYAGANNEIVTFKNDVYVEESNDTTFHVSGNGVVNFEGDLYGDLIFDADGIVNVDDSKSIIVSSVPTSIRTKNDGKGTVNFEGTTTLYTDIGESSSKLNSVYFASNGTSADTYTQDLGYNIYSLDTTIGNNLNKTTVNIKDDIAFGGNLTLNDNSTLNISNNDISIADELNIGKDSTLNFKVYTTDLSAGQAVENGASGSITASSLTIDNSSKINIDYEGSWEGAGQYNLITTSNYLISNYYGTEDNGLVTDNSIIDSIVTVNGTNLTLYADRTSGGSFNPEDLYIVKSEIGKDYSNGASQSLAGYANEADRAGALADIVRNMEKYDGGTQLSAEKKQEMINTQRLLAPTANNSNMQTSITASNLAITTIRGRLSDIRTTEMNNFTPNIYKMGLSSGDYYSFDTSFWLKAMGGKATQDKVNEYDGFDTTTYGFVGGMDKITNEGTIFGAAVAYSTTKTNQDNLASDSSDTTSIQATLYSSLAFENAYIDSYLSYAKHKTDGTRTANSGKLTSSVDADQISAKVETGYSIPVNDGISVTPFASLEYSLLNQKGYTEKGTAYQNDALKVDSLKLNRGTVEVGAKLTSNIELEDTLIIPQLSASVYNSFGDNSADIKAQYIGGGKEFVTPTSELNKTMYNVGLGVETKISDSTSLIFDMDYDRSKDGKFQGYSGTVTFGISF
ncbi:MAG: autotransporter domain-containing protein, partial [Arcobacter sp.]|uniref:autotransporter family protein n=1 Tax=Arcobacter sp. TaxID=1872629 RepID=UPI003D0B7090